MKPLTPGITPTELNKGSDGEPTLCPCWEVK